MPLSGDDITYNNVSSQDNSADTSAPFDSTAYSQVPTSNGDTAQNASNIDDKPWLKQNSGHSANHATANTKNTGAIIALFVVIALFVILAVAVFLYIHGKDSGNGSSISGGYSSYSSSPESKKLREQQKNQIIQDEASDAYQAISNQDSKVSEALSTLMQNSGSSGSSTEVTQAQVDELKSETAKMPKTIGAFKKTKAYHKYSNVRKAYKEYQSKDNDYINAVNNFADSAIAYTKAVKNCNELHDWSSMGSDAAAYTNAKQKTITTCKAAAQDLANSKDGPIKDYSAATIKRMNDAQKQLDGIKALGSSDDIFGDETKFQKFEDLTNKLGKDLNPTTQIGDQNPVYKELMVDTKPDKALIKISTAMYSTDK
ncbi:hypothetical protein OZX57_07240 [Bifidobacterium sp. ESL0682]|uniref:hypothetical protein n=1 Tax=Bifidobacterium sp. ESL0682 TaxID=2983212 RepID=UPI0023F9CFF6|nr:hypothetical protein [Bifidobacterium sp. ESL0682]WEV41751.1 hypothetical protein OZX57_07240 [Bifidobacterium sp. ESL0682]